MQKLLIIFLFFNFMASTAYASTDRIKVSGTLTPSSMNGLEKSFNALPFVEKIDIDPDKMLIIVKVKDGHIITLEDEKKAVNNNGLNLVSVLATNP